MIALLGNLSRDLLPGQAPKAGGGPYHAARAVRLLGTEAVIFARCADADRAELFAPLLALGVRAEPVAGAATATFGFSYDGDRREMRIDTLGDVWRPEDIPELPATASWVLVSPLARSDFPPETLAALAQTRSLLLDGQGLVRVPRVGPLELDADFDPALLRHVSALKLSDEEAEVLGDPAALPVAEVLVTHGSRGVTVYANGRVEHVPAQPIDTDPTGAGDAFGAGYAAARAAGVEPLEAAQRATALVSAMLAAP